MSSPFIGEIRLFAGNFAPAGWAFCNGQTVLISDNDTLFNLIGTTYGGDGQTTFQLPDLRGSVPVHMGQGPGLPSNRVLAEKSGVEAHTLTTSEIPAHSHTVQVDVPCRCGQGNSASPAGKMWAKEASVQLYASASPGPLQAMAPEAGLLTISPAGGSQPHENMAPFLTVSYIISLFGLFPTQT